MIWGRRGGFRPSRMTDLCGFQFSHAGLGLGLRVIKAFGTPLLKRNSISKSPYKGNSYNALSLQYKFFGRSEKTTRSVPNAWVPPGTRFTVPWSSEIVQCNARKS